MSKKTSCLLHTNGATATMNPSVCLLRQCLTLKAQRASARLKARGSTKGFVTVFDDREEQPPRLSAGLAPALPDEIRHLRKRKSNEGSAPAREPLCGAVDVKLFPAHEPPMSATAMAPPTAKTNVRGLPCMLCLYRSCYAMKRCLPSKKMLVFRADHSGPPRPHAACAPLQARP